MEDRSVENKPCIKRDSEQQVENQDCGNEDMFLIIDENGMVKSIKYKTNDGT